MIEVKMYSNGFKVSGHAGFAERGRDIVCSAISAIIQTTLMGLVKFCSAVWDTESESIEIYMPVKNKSSVMLIETMLMGLHEVQNEYPNHIKIETEERWSL